MIVIWLNDDVGILILSTTMAQYHFVGCFHFI